jgi:hypothetical protein
VRVLIFLALLFLLLPASVFVTVYIGNRLGLPSGFAGGLQVALGILIAFAVSAWIASAVRLAR